LEDEEKVEETIEEGITGEEEEEEDDVVGS
jgi:hypothetical protein